MTHLPVLAAIIDLDVTVFFQLALFLFLVVAMNTLVFKPMLALFRQRKEATEGQEKQAQDREQRAEKLVTHYDSEMAAATVQGMVEHNRVKETMLQKEAAALADARAQSAGWLEAELATFSAGVEEARGQAGPAIQRMSAEIAAMLTNTSGNSEAEH